jgi:hypothetical protein
MVASILRAWWIAEGCLSLYSGNWPYTESKSCKAAYYRNVGVESSSIQYQGPQMGRWQKERKDA